MKKSVIGLFVGVFAFLVAVGFSLVSHFSSSQEINVGAVNESVDPAAVQTSVCRMIEVDKTLDNKIVEFEALTYMISDGTIILYPKDCVTQGHNFFLPELDISSIGLASGDLTSVIQGIKRNSTGNYKEVEVRIIGRSRIAPNKGSGVKYSVVPIEIKVISPFRPFLPKGGG